jgi:hypothetical protein
MAVRTVAFKAGFEPVEVVERRGGATVAAPLRDAAPADWADPEPRAVAMATPPAGAIENPAKAVVKRRVFTFLSSDRVDICVSEFRFR